MKLEFQLRQENIGPNLAPVPTTNEYVTPSKRVMKNLKPQNSSPFFRLQNVHNSLT